jgi:excisionase family DNA binding protein
MINGKTPKDRLQKRLYSIKEASEYLGRSEYALREMIWSGKIPQVRFDRRIYIDINDLDALIEKNKMIIVY